VLGNGCSLLLHRVSVENSGVSNSRIRETRPKLETGREGDGYKYVLKRGMKTAEHSKPKEALSGLARQVKSGAPPDHHHYLALSIIDRWMRERAVESARGTLLDYGCGGQPYRALFTPYIERYIGADVAAATGIKLDLELVPGEPAPLPDQSVDTVLSTQVIEHVPEVDVYLAECRRLLKPNGTLVLTAPMHWRHHEAPYDFLRFTRFGLTRLLEKHGFAIGNLEPCGGVYVLMGQTFLDHLAERGVKARIVFRVVNWIALFLDRRYPDLEDTVNWHCIASKVP
jgi:SAM-dependent methyltransferase